MTKHNILKHKELFEFPAHPAVSHRCRDLIYSLIQDPEDRLCSKRYKFKDLAASAPTLKTPSGSSSSSKTAAERFTSSSSSAAKARDFSGRYVFPRDGEDIKAHKWFRGIPWDRLQQFEPPFVPRIQSADDTHYFDEEDEISDWSESKETDDLSEDMPPPMPLDIQQQLTTARSPQQFTNLTLTPHHAYMASMPATTMGFPLGNLTPYSSTPVPPPTTIPQQHPLTTQQQPHSQPVIPSHKHEAAALFLRPLRRSVQRWALAAIAIPHNSTRLHALDSQIEGLPSLDLSEKTRLRQFIRLFGRRDRKRPRDRLLRDLQTKAVVMDVRKKTAFLGYTWRRMRPLEESRPMVIPPQRQSGGLFDGAGGTNREQEHHHGGGGGGGQYDYGYGWWGGVGGAGAHWGGVGDGRWLHGKGRFSWR